MRGNRAARCEYDYHPAVRERAAGVAGGGAPGQLVFEARPTSVPTPRRRNGVPLSFPQEAQPPPASWTGSDDSLGRARIPPASSHHTGETPALGEEEQEEGVSPLRQFWHGSRAGDRYVSPFDGRAVVVPKEVVFGEDDAIVYWGRSHEANFVPRITDMTTLLLRSDTAAADDEPDNISTLLEVERHTRPRESDQGGQPGAAAGAGEGAGAGTTPAAGTPDPELLALVPPRETTDRLWQTYSAHFASYCRVLHMPTFDTEYQRFWATQQQQAPRHFLPQLLSICAIASCFRDEDRLRGEGRVRTWIEAVRVWLFRADPRAQLTIGFLQAHLLMLIAGDVHWIKIDRSWISSGSLIRNAISAGLHREPRDFFRISPFHAELRRRLWYSIVEYDLLTSFAKGRIPTVRQDEYDCELPSSNWDKHARLGTTTPSALLHQAHTLGASAESPHMSVILAQSLPLRSRVCHAVNSITLSLDYDEVLRLDTELKAFLRTVSRATENAAHSHPRPSSPTPSPFQRTLAIILSQRAVIALHAPFVARALHDPKWSYSRTRCLETASTVLAEALSLLDGGSGDATTGDDGVDSRDRGPFATITNICRCEVSNSVFLICHELLARAVERRGLAEHHLPPTPAPRALAGLGLLKWDWDGGTRWGGSAGGGNGNSGGLEVLVGLVERTATAMERVSKPDLVSQRTCAWVRLSADLCRAALAPEEEGTIPAMKGIIRRGIQGWRVNRQAHHHGVDHSGPADAVLVSHVGDARRVSKVYSEMMC